MPSAHRARGVKQGSTGMGSKRYSTFAQWMAQASAVALMGLSPAWADFDDALRAYASRPNGQIDQAKVSEALDLWQKYAVAGDVLSREVLGDIYSNNAISTKLKDGNAVDAPLPADTGIISTDRVRALAWYTIAATHEFEEYNQSPDFRMINARIRAGDRIRALKAVMTTEEVRAAEQRVVDILSGESEFDLYRLGRMFQEGHGLPKDNVRALMYYNLALGRARNANQAAAERKSFLVDIMAPDDITKAETLAADWEPPLPEALRGPSPRSRELAEKSRILRDRELRMAIEDIEREFHGRNEHVIQNALAAMGLYLGEIDGSIGPQTRQAIERFQFALLEDSEELTAEQKRDRVTGQLTPAQKVELIRQAASVNHPQSQYIYGVMYAEGIGVTVDGEEAVRWLKRSASFGYPLAHYALGKYYRTGIYGDNPVAPSRSEATYHLGQAAALGYDDAQKELAELYEFNFARD